MKPDWCDDHTWNEATSTARLWYREEWDPDEYIQQSLVESIARALLEAEQRGRKAGLEEAAETAENEAIQMEETGLKHSEDSSSRDRCFARARTASTIAVAIRAKANGGGE